MTHKRCNPLALVDLPGCGELTFDGLTLVLGANSSGKTHLLRDIDHRVSGIQRRLVVAKRVTVRLPPDPAEFAEYLAKEQHVVRRTNNQGTEVLRPTAARLGQGEAAADLSMSQLASDWQDFRQLDPSDPNVIIRFLQRIRHMLVAGLFIETRLTMTNSGSKIDEEHQPPSTELQALYINAQPRERLAAEVRRTFRKLVWPDGTKPNALILRVSDDPDRPPREQWHDPRIARQYRAIEQEGDGLKSYVGICMSLLLGRTLVTTIDEPELCLHPPQAYNLGRFIGAEASGERKTIVATHSSHFLRGVLSVSTDFKVVRLTRSGHEFGATFIEPELLADVLRRPTVIAETILDGLFADAVLVVEGEGDRILYQAVFESIPSAQDLDIHFAGVGGAGGMSETCRLYSRLQIPIAVVGDFDVLWRTDTTSALINALASPDHARDLLARIEAFRAQAGSLAPQITPSSIDEKLGTIAGMRRDWASHDEIPMRKALIALAKALDATTDLKAKGVDHLDSSLRDTALDLLRRLAEIGFFVVPVGDLEGWLRGYSIPASRGKKWEWATAAAATVRQIGMKDNDVWDFARSIAAFFALRRAAAVAST